MRTLNYITNNAYDTIILTDSEGLLAVSRWDVTPHAMQDFLAAVANPALVLDWEVGENSDPAIDLQDIDIDEMGTCLCIVHPDSGVDYVGDAGERFRARVEFFGG